MEDVGIPIKNDPLVVKPNLSEIRTREEVNSEKVNGDEKRQKLEIVTNNSPKQVGLLDNLLAKLSSPMVSSNNPGDDSVIGSDDVGTNDAGVGGGAGAGGGVIDKISSFFSRGDEEEDEGEGENGKSDGGEGSKENGVGEGSEEGGSNSNGASIISSLIPDGVAPASDEASILIHSVVHD